MLKAVIGLAIASGLAGIVYLATKVKAKAKPREYNCPFCEATFTTYEDLVAHVQLAHPGERIPLPIEWE